MGATKCRATPYRILYFPRLYYDDGMSTASAATYSEFVTPRTEATAANWLAALALVAAAHAAVWWGFTYKPFGATALAPLPIVQVSLVTRLPPKNKVTPLQAKTPPETAAKPDAGAHETRDYAEPIYSATYLNNDPPAYPMVARRRGQEGTVIVSAMIHDDGHCHHALLKKSSGHDILDKAALDAVRGWRFTPARRGGQTTVAWVDVPITFRLSSN